jgi:hypothetical protein
VLVAPEPAFVALDPAPLNSSVKPGKGERGLRRGSGRSGCGGRSLGCRCSNV